MTNWRAKKFGNISGGELAQVLDVFDEAWEERCSWRKQEVGTEEWCSSVTKLMAIPSWLPLYREPLILLIARLVTLAGVGPEFLAAVQKDRPAESVLELVRQLPEDPPADPSSMAVIFSLVGNLEAISHYSRSITDMFVACEKGEIQALMQALTIDSHISSLPFFQAALRLGQLNSDASMAEEMFKAVRGPHRKRAEYPKLRWVEYLLRDQGAFEVCTREEIYELCVEHLQVYDPAGEKKDPKAALFSRFRTWQKEAGIQNPRFGFSAKRQ